MKPLSRICSYEDFEIISVVKKGVYTTSLVQDPFSGTRYVKKELSKDKRSIYQKLQELKHQGLAEIIEVVEKDDKIIVIIEYAVGETLKSILDNKIKLDDRVATSYIQQLASILNIVHQNGIIHRDINPSNIIVATNGQVKLIDFDIARFYKYSQTEDTQLLGTPGYAAPEQFGFNQSTSSSDIYALGVLLNVMLTGMKPNEMQINNEELAMIVKNCTAMDQSLRYQDVMQLDYDLRRLRQTIVNDFPKKPNKKTSTHFKKISIVLGFLFLLSIGYIIFQALQTPQESTVQLQDADEPESNLYDQELEQPPITTDNSQEMTTEFELPILLDSGYGISSSSRGDMFLHYGLIIKNPNENYAIDFPSVRITARCANGTILGTTDATLSRIYPTQTVAHGFTAFEVDEMPESVDFELLSVEDWNRIHGSALQPYEPLIVENTSFSEGVVLTNFTGEVINENDYDIERVGVTVIFRDENDQIVGGGFTFVRDLSANGTAPFDFTVNTDIKTDNYEIYASTW